MLKLIIILLLIILIAVIVLCIVGHTFLKMPFALDFKDKKKTGIFSKKWLDWAQDNKHDLIYNYVVPRKIRQDRYAHSHVAHYRVVTNDCYYDTDSAEYFWTRYMKLPNGDPCAMHYYKTKNGEFFCMTSALGSKDSFSVIPEREMKKLLKNEPNLYLKYIPDAERNKDLLDLKKKTEEKEKEQSAKQDVSPTVEDDAAQYASDIEALEKELSEKKKALKDAKRKAKEAEKDKKAPSKKGFHIDINISIGKSEANTAAAKEDEPTDNVDMLSEKEATDIKTMNDVVDKPEDSADTPKTVVAPPAETEGTTPIENVPENEEKNAENDNLKEDATTSSQGAPEPANAVGPSTKSSEERAERPSKKDESTEPEVIDDFGDDVSELNENSVDVSTSNDDKQDKPEEQKPKDKESADNKKASDKGGNNNSKRNAIESASNKSTHASTEQSNTKPKVEIPVAKRPSENNTDKQKPQEEKKGDSPQKGMPHPHEDIKQDTKPADTQEQVESSAKDNPTLDTNKSNSEAKPAAEEKTDAQPDAPKSSTKKRERRKITMKPAQVEEESEMGFDNAEKFAKSEEDSAETDMDMEEPEIQAPSEEEIQMEAEKEEHDEKVANLDNLAKSMPSMPHTDN